MALLNTDGSVAKAWPVNSIDGNGKPVLYHGNKKGIGNPMYGPLQIGKAEPVNLQFGHFGISAWPTDTGGTSHAGSVDESRGDGTETGSRYYSSCCSSPRMSDGPAKEVLPTAVLPKEEQSVSGSDEEADDPPEADIMYNFVLLKEFQIENLRSYSVSLWQIDLILHMEGSVDEESTKSDEEYDDLAMQDVQENGYWSDDDEESKGKLVHVREDAGNNNGGNLGRDKYRQNLDLFQKTSSQLLSELPFSYTSLLMDKNQWSKPAAGNVRLRKLLEMKQFLMMALPVEVTVVAVRVEVAVGMVVRVIGFFLKEFIIRRKYNLNAMGYLRVMLRGPPKRFLLRNKCLFELLNSLGAIGSANLIQLKEKVTELIKLEEVKRRFQSQFDREPTLVEWAEAVGMSCRVLQSHLHSGNNSREKMIYANFRMVVHVAKLYQGRGLNLQDLLQEGSMGLMRSLEKFKPQVGCRFSTYAYWWIRQRIRKAIYQNSRTIRLPENVYNLLRKVKSTKELYSREGHRPTNEELAKHVGITVEKLETLLSSTRMPLSIQQPVWLDQSTTFQEITADTEIESTDLCVSKQMMRRHVHNLLRTLSPRERRIIRLRYGIEDGKPKSLAEIGSVFRLSKERIRQLENRALNKLKQCLSSHGLGAYSDLLI
ncbi:hypothetical protein HHK36_016647 [Tetracentron sinense]|uniref:RNA polymerase sigma-70 domain-containing protein n=1 Tax=Tetracentron sinense TaxID=13715 RepID=A0A834Z1P5_TETSI|nr:hypothetical protein HHK36_016647 [Tetracentron sinense]